MGTSKLKRNPFLRGCFLASKTRRSIKLRTVTIRVLKKETNTTRADGAYLHEWTANVEPEDALVELLVPATGRAAGRFGRPSVPAPAVTGQASSGQASL